MQAIKESKLAAKRKHEAYLKEQERLALERKEKEIEEKRLMQERQE